MNATLRLRRNTWHSSRAALWFGLLGGAVAWLLHLLTAYAVAEFGCVGTLGQQAYRGISLVAWSVIAVSLLLGIVSATATVVALRLYVAHAANPDTDPVQAAERMTAWVGGCSSGIFTLAIAFESIPLWYYFQGC